MEKNDYYDLKIILWLILFLVFGIIIIMCKPESHGTVMTVNGPEHSGKMGITLTHEHILVDFIGADSTGYFRWNRDSVLKKAIPFLIDVRKRGLKTFIDCTPAYIGRDPLLLKELARKTGLNIITNTGYYGALGNKFIPQSFYSSDASQIAKLWIDEFTNGIEETGIKPGFIKIGVAPDDILSPEHRKLITAAALTHLKTGLVIASHTGPENPALEQIRILKDSGVDPSAFIWVHAQSGTTEGNIKAAREGAWISFDNIRYQAVTDPGAPGSLDKNSEKILEMKKNGLLNRVLISHDAGWYDPAQPGGGTFRGFTDIFDFMVPALKSKGMTDDDILQILVKNPAEAFSIRIRAL